MKYVLALVFTVMLVVSLSSCTSNDKCVSGYDDTPAQTQEPSPTPAPTLQPNQEPSPEPTISPYDKAIYELKDFKEFWMKASYVADFTDKDRAIAALLAEELLAGYAYTDLNETNRNSYYEILYIPELINLLYTEGMEGRLNEELVKMAQSEVEELYNNRITQSFQESYPDLFFYSAKILIENGWYDTKIEDGFYPETNELGMFWLTWDLDYFVNCYEEFDDALSISQRIVKDFMPLMLTYVETNFVKSGTVITGLNDSVAICRDYSRYMPNLSTEKTTTLKEGKYLFVFREDRLGDISEWHTNLQILRSLPAEYIPSSLSEITHLIVIDSHWIEKSRYNNGVMGYVCSSKIAIYDYETGKIIAELDGAQSTLSTVVMMQQGQTKWFEPCDWGKVSKIVTAYLK